MQSAPKDYRISVYGGEIARISDEKLNKNGITTIGELAAKDEAWLIANFGKSTGAWLHRASWGRDDSPISLHSEPVSISRETTFDRDLHAVRDKAELGVIFTELCDKLADCAA